jgi:O-acetyl-ADP-ribose deacetylase (regulator of RNase III)
VIELVRGDITSLHVDAIVNAANSELRGGGGVDGAIHRAAGPALLEELQQWNYCPPGSAVLTAGHELPARSVIHAVGPVWHGGRKNEAVVLRATYDSAFAVAIEQGDIRTIAFPAISTGVYSYPKAEAARIAVSAMRAYEAHFNRIVACVFDDDNLAAYQAAMQEDGWQ